MHNPQDYVNGERIQVLADLEYTRGTVLPKVNCVVYACGDILPYVFNAIQENFDNKYILITHNSDKNMGQSEFDNLPQNVVKWYSQNMNVYDEENQRVVGVPIGMANSKWSHSDINQIIKVNQEILKVDSTAYLCIKIDTNPIVRIPWYKFAIRTPGIKVDNWPIDRNTFLRGIRQSYFTLSPPGNGVDCHRHWETFFSNRIPIVQDDIWLNHFPELPFLKINNINMDEAFFCQLCKFGLEQYDSQKWCFDKMYIQYWRDRISLDAKSLL